MQKKNQMEFESKLISVMQKVENQKKQLSEIEKNTKFPSNEVSTTQERSFPLRISSLNVTKSTFPCKFIMIV